MSPLPEGGKTGACSSCGKVYWVALTHRCCRLRLSDAYISQQMRGIQAQFERPSGRHARPDRERP